MRSCSRMLKLIFPFTRPVGNTDVQRVIFNTALSTAEREPSSVTVQHLMSYLYGARFCVLQSVFVIGDCAAVDVLSTARGTEYCRTAPSSGTVQWLLSSALRRAVPRERILWRGRRHRSLCSNAPLCGFRLLLDIL